MAGREVDRTEASLDYEGVLSALAGMLGHEVLVAAGPTAGRGRVLQAVGRLQGAIAGQAEITRRRAEGDDTFICSLDTGATITIAERRFTRAALHGTVLTVVLGPLRVTVEDLGQVPQKVR